MSKFSGSDIIDTSVSNLPEPLETSALDAVQIHQSDVVTVDTSATCNIVAEPEPSSE